MDILRQRLARGEIDDQEFEQKKKALFEKEKVANNAAGGVNIITCFIQQGRMMRKKSLILIIVIGLATGVFMIYPVVLSVYLYEAQNNQRSWGTTLGDAYRIIFSFHDWQQLLIGVLFGLMGIAFVLKILVGKKRLQAIVELQNRNRIIDLIRKGKKSYIAFQPKLLWDLEQKKSNEALALVAAKTIAGFMNTQGGHLFIGIDDEGRFLGLEKDYRALKKLSQELPFRHSPDRVHPDREGFRQGVMRMVVNILDADCCPLVRVSISDIEGKDICHIQVKRSASPVYVHIGDRAHFFIRSGKSTLELDVREVLDHIENLSR